MGQEPTDADDEMVRQMERRRVTHDPSAVNEGCRTGTSGGACARFATSRAIIRRRTIAVAHWNDAET